MLQCTDCMQLLKLQTSAIAVASTCSAHLSSQRCPYAGRGAYTAVSVAPALGCALVCWHAPHMPAPPACGLPAMSIGCIAAHTQHVTLQTKKAMAMPALHTMTL